MDRRCTGFLLTLAIASLAALSACVGKGTRNTAPGGVQSVTLNPANNLSLEFGATRNFGATARDSAGKTVFTTIHFSSDNNAALTIADNGQACAGTWDSLSNPVFCRPGVTGIAKVTATADGVSSPTTTVYVHQHIQSIQITPVSQPADPCFSQGVIWNFQAQAFSANQVDITNSVGPLSWSVTPANVLTVDNIAGLPQNQIQVTASNPGQAQLFAGVSGTNSTPFKFTTCLVSSIMLQIQNGAGNFTTINAGSTKTIETVALDTLGVTLSKPPLTWSTSNPEIATVSSAGVVTARQTAGFANISASCTPPTCNIGVLPGLPVYSTGGKLKDGQSAFGVITAHVTNTTVPTATAWTATTGCGDAFGCTSVLFQVTPGKTPIGVSVVLPYTPNAMLFNPAGTRIYLGSKKGLMFFDVSGTSVSTVSPATTPCNVAVCGKPLAISADGNRVVVADTDTIPNQVYILDSTKAAPPVDLLIDGATAAAFSPDHMKVFILTSTGKMYVYSTVDSLLSVPVAASVTDLAFAADGSFAYVAGTPGSSVSAFSTCDIPGIGSVDLGSVGTARLPSRIAPSPDVQESPIDADHSRITQKVIALEPGDIATPTRIQSMTAQFTRNPLQENQFVCNLPLLSSFTASSPVDLGFGNFTPLLMKVTGDGSKVILVAENIPAVLVFDVASGTTQPIGLVNNPTPLAAAASLDGTHVFVAACDADHENPNTCGSVHIVNIAGGGDIQQAVYTNVNTKDSLCSGLDPNVPCLPNLIAVRPQ